MGNYFRKPEPEPEPGRTSEWMYVQELLSHPDHRLYPGDRLEFYRGTYRHWGLYHGTNDIIHLSGESDSGTTKAALMSCCASGKGLLSDFAEVRIDNILDVAQHSLVRINNIMDHEKPPLKSSDALARARNTLGKTHYSLVSRNCEHFTNWCRYEDAISEQVNTVANVGSRVSIAAAVIAAVGALLRLLFGGRMEQ